jgi:hypothetical protein
MDLDDSGRSELPFMGRPVTRQLQKMASKVARDTWGPFSIPAQCLIDQGQLLYELSFRVNFLNFFEARISALPSWVRCRPSLAWWIKATS